jgi:ATP-dependent helicase/nuclease subunit B
MVGMAPPSVFTIEAGQNFLRHLIDGLIARYPEPQWHNALLLLPTRRAAGALRDAFFKELAGDNSALLLPRIRVLSEVDEDELLLTGDAALAEEILALPPAMPAMRRRMLLTSMILAKREPDVSQEQAFRLAGELGRLIDQTLIENTSLTQLETLVEGDLAEHWQQIVRFLSIISEVWPAILAEEGMIESIDRRQRLMRLFIRRWQETPPDFPVIAAGSTGSHPVTAELLKTIAALPQGHVVLPGLDTHLDEDSWQVMGPTHPQYQLKKLLHFLDRSREQVPLWTAAAENPRTALLSEALRPAESTDRWRGAAADMPPQSWQGLTIMAADNEYQEAMLAALLLRQCVEDKGKTAALVTPDRMLGARVAAALRRWNIEVNDSAGTPLAETPAGSYFRLLLGLMRHDVKPSAVMAFLKHPFTTLGMKRGDLLNLARALEKDFFRKSIRGSGFPAWLSALRHKDEAYAPLLRRLHDMTESFHHIHGSKPFSFWAEAHYKLAREAGDPERLWQGEEGEAISAFLDDFLRHAGAAQGECHDYIAIFTHAVQQQPLRASHGQHPHLHILGLQEARMLSFDCLILAGLNEGIWPQETSADPWMSPQMRIRFGLPHPDQYQGQTAHDFVQLAAQPNVTLLHTRRKGDAPAIPSRFLLRLETMLGLLGASAAVRPSEPWQIWLKALDHAPEMEPCAAPAVAVPPEALPTELSASDIELWMRDPYAFYARRVLGLKPLGHLDAEWDARERGIVIHGVLHDLARSYPNDWPAEARDVFVQKLEEGFLRHGCTPEDMQLMLPRLMVLADAYWDYENQRRQRITGFATEQNGAITLDVFKDISQYQPKLQARADRIETLPDGALALLDYKSGAVPTQKDVQSALRPQLLVEAIIAEKGGFAPSMPAAPVGQLFYVNISENQDLVKPTAIKDIAPQDMDEIHWPGLLRFIAAFLDKDARFIAVPRPSLSQTAVEAAYGRLARVAEWSRGALEQEDL